MSVTENPFFPEIKGNFGFGCMRLPTVKGGGVDREQMEQMVRLYLQSGFNYFDTARGYHRGQSERILRELVTDRYPREQIVIADKLSEQYFHSAEEIRPLFLDQLDACGLTYFDFYLMHAQDRRIYRKFTDCRAYEIASQLKREGKIRHIGISFHDRPELLRQILAEHPEIEAVQLQLNYLDYEDSAIESGKLLELCQSSGVPVFVMEPVKGGSLANLPRNARVFFDALQKDPGRRQSPSSYALRFAASFPGVSVVLSGMSSMEQLRENLSTMSACAPLSEAETRAIDQVRRYFRAQNLIPCTACRYCVEGCPQNILIPDLFSCMNAKKQFHTWNQDYYYHFVYTSENGKASDCVKCGQCERSCPQHLAVMALMEQVAAEFEKKKRRSGA